MSSVNLLIVLILCIVVGAFTGLVLGDLVGDLYLAIIAGFLATVVAIATRNIKIPQLVVIFSALAIDRPIPVRLIIYSIVTSLVAGAAAVGVATVTDLTSSVMIGSLGGLFAGILMAMQMMVYDMNRGKGSGPLS